MNKLMAQILKFGVVGGLSFLIDFVITNVIALVFEKCWYDSDKCGYGWCVFWFRYISDFQLYLSMQWVFERREDMDKRREFVIFVVLSTFGLVLNELIILLCMSMINNIGWCGAFTQWCTNVVNIVASMTFDGMATAGSKIIATAIVMVYNFVTRKIFLEKKEEPTTEA